MFQVNICRIKLERVENKKEDECTVDLTKNEEE